MASQERKHVILVLVVVIVFVGSGFAGFLIRTGLSSGKTFNTLIPSGDGSLIGIKVTIPNQASTSNPVPLVILIHGLAGSKEMMQSLATEFLRRGIGSIAIDLPGHGETTSILSFSDFNKTSEDLQIVLDHARDLGMFDLSKVAIIGHSLGASVAMYEAARHPERYQSVVIIGNAGTFSSGLNSPFNLANETNPRNVLIVIGKQDQLIDIETARESLARMVADSKMNVGTLYGDFVSGTARKLVTPTVDHLLEPYEPSAINEIISWVLASFRLSFHSSFPMYFLNEVFSLIQIIVFLILILAVWDILKERTTNFQFISIGQKTVSNITFKETLSFVSVIAYSVGFSILYFVGALIGTTLLFLPGISLVSVILPSFSTGMLIWFFGVGVIILFIFWWDDRNALSLVMKDLIDSITEKDRLKYRISFGLVIFSLIIFLVIIQQLLFHQDLRVFVPFLRINFDWRRWLAFVTLTVVLTPIFSLEHQFHQAWLNSTRRPSQTSSSRGQHVMDFLKVFLARSGILLLLGMMQYLVKGFFGPLSFVIMLSMPIIFLLTFLTIFNVFAIKNGWPSDEVGMLLGLLVGLVMGMNLPYVVG